MCKPITKALNIYLLSPYSTRMCGIVLFNSVRYITIIIIIVFFLFLFFLFFLFFFVVVSFLFLFLFLFLVTHILIFTRIITIKV